MTTHLRYSIKKTKIIHEMYKTYTLSFATLFSPVILTLTLTR